MNREKKYYLKKELGFWEVTLSGIGIIFGAGIYALIGRAANLSGNAIWLSFAIGAFLALFTGLSYAELSSMFPKAGAEYVYVEHAFGKKLAFFVGWMIIVSGIFAGATVSLGFAGYFSALFKTPLFAAAAGLIACLTLLNFYGIKESAEYAVAATIIESLGLVIIILIGLPYITSVNLLEMPHGIAGVMSAAALIFFAYLGFEDIVKLSAETKNASRVIPIALLTAVAVSTVFYILVSLSAVSVLGWQALGSSAAPLADVAAKALGSGTFAILSVIALFATSNTVLLFLVATSRIIYGMAEERSLPGIFSAVHKARRTPYIAIITAAILAIIFSATQKIDLVANITDLLVFITFAVINASVIYLRYKWPSVNRPFKIPLSIGKFPLLPVFGIIFNVLLITSLNSWILAYGFFIIAIGLIVYEILQHCQKP